MLFSLAHFEELQYGFSLDLLDDAERSYLNFREILA